jgi:hypothetical protein
LERVDLGYPAPLGQFLQGGDDTILRRLGRFRQEGPPGRRQLEQQAPVVRRRSTAGYQAT